MKFSLSLLFTFFFLGTLSAQIIDNSKCQAFTDAPFFDTAFVKNNSVKRIIGEISTKGNLEVIKDKKLVSIYEFDRTGKLALQLGSFTILGNKDTTFISYHYDTTDNLITKRTNDAYGFFSNNFVYNENNQMVTKTYCREENDGVNRYHFELGKQYVIVKESYTYEDTDSILLKEVYNNHDRIYQRMKYYYDEFDLLVKEEKQYVISRKKSSIEYDYDDQGKVVEKTIFKDFTKKEEYEKVVFTYDLFGNLEYMDEYKNEVHITHKEILYDKSTYMLKALLVQDVATNFITIVKFRTEFYN